ncbi:hypothetical protein EDD85DRAFT_786088 [Armillaria nabsnona]|nr:hypothetical protein EDD85DRAFT_786088 [Armillaria nabsnona]
MAPRRVFQTEQERRAAHNATSRRSYQNSLAWHRHAINQPRRETYQAAGNPNNRVQSCLEPLIRPAARRIDIEVNSGETHVQSSSNLAEALDQIERLRQRFDIVTENDSRHFADKIYHAYIDTIGHTQLRGRRRVIENTLVRLSHFEKLGYKYEHVVLNGAGTGKDVERVQRGDEQSGRFTSEVGVMGPTCEVQSWVRMLASGLAMIAALLHGIGLEYSKLFAMRTLLQVHFWVEGEFVFLIGFKTESEPTEAAPSVEVGA